MTVGELIKELERYDKDQTVTYWTGQSCNGTSEDEENDDNGKAYVVLS